MKSFSGSDLKALLCSAATRCVFNKLGFRGVALHRSEWHRLLGGDHMGTNTNLESWVASWINYYYLFLI